MIGARPMEEKEVQSVLSNLKNDRDKCLFILGIKTGYRISELLSLRVQDVVQYGVVRDSITVERKSMKGKHNSRTVPLHREVREALQKLMVLDMRDSAKLFPIGRMQASRIIKEAVQKAKVQGNVTTHSMRKTFAKKIHLALGRDILKTQKALGHKNVSSTVSYLSFDQNEIDDAIKEA